METGHFQIYFLPFLLSIFDQQWSTRVAMYKPMLLIKLQGHNNPAQQSIIMPLGSNCLTPYINSQEQADAIKHLCLNVHADIFKQRLLRDPTFSEVDAELMVTITGEEKPDLTTMMSPNDFESITICKRNLFVASEFTEKLNLLMKMTIQEDPEYPFDETVVTQSNYATVLHIWATKMTTVTDALRLRFLNAKRQQLDLEKKNTNNSTKMTKQLSSVIEENRGKARLDPNFQKNPSSSINPYEFVQYTHQAATSACLEEEKVILHKISQNEQLTLEDYQKDSNIWLLPIISLYVSRDLKSDISNMLNEKEENYGAYQFLEKQMQNWESVKDQILHEIELDLVSLTSSEVSKGKVHTVLSKIEQKMNMHQGMDPKSSTRFLLNVQPVFEELETKTHT